MKITNLTSRDIFLGFIGSNGAKIIANSYGIFDDKYGSHPSLANMVNSGIVTVSSYDVDDSAADIGGSTQYGKNQDDFVGPAEFNNIAKGLYIVKSTWSKTSVVQASAVGAYVESVTAGTFDTTVKNVLKMKFDGTKIILCNLPIGHTDSVAVAAALNANSLFSSVAVAADNAGKLKITSKTVGVNSNVEFMDEYRSAVQQLYLTAPAVLDTKTVATVTVPVVGPIGVGMQGVEVTLALFTTLGGSTPSTNFWIQRETKGFVKSGIRTNSIVVLSGEDGNIVFEVAAPVAITESECWLDVVLPANHYFAQKPVAKLRIF